MSNYKKSCCTFFLVRHGETDWNLQKLVQGHTDKPLNKTGIKQAKVLKEKLGHIKFDAFYSSDLLRARQTAEIVAQKYGLAVRTTKALRERRYGNFEGKGVSYLNEFYNELEKTVRNDPSASDQIYLQKGIETDNEVTKRLLIFLREAAVLSPGKTIFIGSHGGVMRLILTRLSGKAYRPGDIDNTAFLEIKSDGVDFFIESIYGVKSR